MPYPYGKGVTLNIFNNTNTDLYLNENNVLSTTVIAKNTAVSGTSSLDGVVIQLFWNDPVHPSGEIGQLLLSIANGVTVIPGGDSWLTANGVVEDVGSNSPIETFNILGPKVKWTSNGYGGGYDIYIIFSGTLPVSK